MDDELDLNEAELRELLKQTCLKADEKLAEQPRMKIKTVEAVRDGNKTVTCTAADLSGAVSVLRPFSTLSHSISPSICLSICISVCLSISVPLTLRSFFCPIFLHFVFYYRLVFMYSYSSLHGMTIQLHGMTHNDHDN